jgi:hypothetical protein
MTNTYSALRVFAGQDWAPKQGDQGELQAEVRP